MIVIYELKLQYLAGERVEDPDGLELPRLPKEAMDVPSYLTILEELDDIYIAVGEKTVIA